MGRKELVLEKVFEASYCFNGCWETTYGLCPSWPYPVVHFHGRRVKVIILMYEEFFGLVPAGLVLDHTCENKGCINPMHVEPVTNKENTLRYHQRRPMCKNGHLWTLDNTRYNKGKRACKECDREAVRAWRSRKRGTSTDPGQPREVTK